MKVIRAYLKAWTASYRYPPLATEFQPTINVPPIATCYGIISSVAGRPIGPDETKVGVVSPSRGRGTDLEKIFQVGKTMMLEKTNVFRREFLFEPEVYLYITNISLENCFRHPRYPPLLGRSYDLACIAEVKIIDLEECSEAVFKDTLLPFPIEDRSVSAPIFALPVAFDNAIPRRPLQVGGFYLIGRETTVRMRGIYTDPEKGWGVYLHGSLRKVQPRAT